jgi:large subunit ribosomal protein L4
MNKKEKAGAIASVLSSKVDSEKFIVLDELKFDEIKAKKMGMELQSKIYESSQNHKHNIEQVNENIKSILNLLNYENMDITKLLNGGAYDFDLEIEEKIVE